MGSELIYRGHEAQPTLDAYSSKPPKPWLAVTRPIRYVLREKRLVFVLVGIAIATLVFSLLSAHHGNNNHYQIPDLRDSRFLSESTQLTHRGIHSGFVSFHPGGKMPLGLKRKGLRIVVTGGAGFVGSHLVDRLIARGDSVIVVDNFFTGRKENVMHHFGNPNFELIRHDVVEPLLLEVDQIYHLACPASPVHYKFNPVKTIKTNVVGTLNMLGLAKRVGARFLLTSTSEVYGDPLQHPQVETYWGNVNPIGVRSCYDEGKRTAETLTMDYHRGANVEVEGLMRLMEGEHVGPFNLGNPGEFTMLELAQVVQETIDPNAKIEFRPNTEDDPHKRKPDITKAKDLLGWEPKVPLRKGLPLMVSDFRQRIFGDHKAEGASTATSLV
ncbi:UDP-glucuronic acid decarboxylase [Actinidia chinensis var. chinensis]|uniref:UDP-glucuronic acid decarboxylase 1 n=1 Tax=Actinidia chinensis var. chinensis TaxID=1590841 RepID=A0A2R6QHS1_ACTCC|nr:UDP-glucuronic acid decarboxylase [Actinidia chinensis var. chinensis]